MRMLRFSLLGLISPCFVALFLTACQPVAQTNPGSTPAAMLSWSDPETWGGVLPAEGDTVTIEQGQKILLDVNPPPLAGLYVQGELHVAEQDLNLVTDYVLVTGTFQLGTEAVPYRRDATITLTDNYGQDPSDPRFKGFVVSGGLLELHGMTKTSWLRLGRSALQGDRRLVLEQDVDWQVGDQIVIASTDYDFQQAEERVLTAVTGNTVSFAEPLEYLHWGELQRFDGHSVDTRAEVGLLSRNIVIQGDAEALSSGAGGHLMVTGGGTARIAGASFYNMGQRGVSGRYPVHFHLNGDSSASYLRSSTVYKSFNRCVALHGSDNLHVIDNVAYDAPGHCYFIEDGNERGNVLEHNLGLVTREPRSSDLLLQTDGGTFGPATFWVTHPDNVLRDNAAAGSAGSGFWYALPEHPTGPSADETVFPRLEQLAAFENNTTHSNAADGFHMDGGLGFSSLLPENAPYQPLVNPLDPTSATQLTYFSNLTAYRNRLHGAWLRGDGLVLQAPTLADNGIGAAFASKNALVVDAVVIGETANKGTPNTFNGEATGLDGRTLPHFWDPAFRIRGYDFYDGTVRVKDSYFAAYTPNAQRAAAAFDYLNYTHFYTDPNNATEALSFAKGTLPVRFESVPLPATLDAGKDGYRSAVFRDIDGTVTGSANSSVVMNTPFLTTASCDFKPDWNAAVCPHRYVSLTLLNLDPDPKEVGVVGLVRSDGVTHDMLGVPVAGAPNTEFRTNLIYGDRYSYRLAMPSDRWRLRLDAANPKDALQVALPYPDASVYIYRNFNYEQALSQVNSLDALAASSGDSYYYDGANLHVKLRVAVAAESTLLDICRRPLCDK